MEAEVFLDELTGNMFVKHKGAVWSVNAVIVPGAAQWMKRLTLARHVLPTTLGWPRTTCRSDPAVV
jgi:hypothetical protein